MRTGRELEPVLWRMQHGEWQRFGSSQPYDNETFVSPGADGRIDIMIKGRVPCGIASIVATLLETSLYHMWMAPVTRSTEIHRASHFRRLVHLRCMRVPPFALREGLVHAYGDIISPTSIMAYLKTVDADDDATYADERRAREEASRAEGAVRILIDGGIHLETDDCEDGAATRVAYYVKLDLRLGFLPDWLMDLLLRSLAPMLLPELVRHAARFDVGGDLHHRIVSGPDAPVYAELMQRLRVLNRRGPPRAAA